MSMTNAEELGKSAVFVKLAVMLSPLVEEAVRQGMAIMELERRPLRGLAPVSRTHSLSALN